MSRRDQPYIPLYVQDFLTDEKLRECSASSVGVYIMLMCVMHKQEKYGTIQLREKDRQSEDIIRDFARKLAKHLPFDVEVIRNALRELLDEDVIQLNGDRISQKRMVRDADVSEKRSAAGRKGSTTTNTKFAAAKGAANITANDPAKPEETPPPKKTKRQSCLTSEQMALFERFYAAYPKKVDRATAERAWAKIDPQPDEAMTDRIVAAVEKAKRLDDRFRERQFTPNPASWLNAKGYLNDYTQEGQYGSYTDRSSSGGFTADPEQFKPSNGFNR